MPYEIDDFSWVKHAACRGVNTSLFFPEQGGDTETPTKVCRQCPVREPCLEYALDHYEFGVWGGQSDRGRRTIRKRRSILNRNNATIAS